MPDDEFIAERIMWRASKHRLPNQDTYAFADAPEEVRSSIAGVSRRDELGIPVLVFGGTPDQWTVIGTQAVISYHSGVVHHCALSEIADFDSGMPRVPKQIMEYLNVTRTDGAVTRLWGPRGSQFFALWNVLLCLSRMNLTTDTS